MSKAEIYQNYVYPALSHFPAEEVHDATLGLLKIIQDNSFTIRILEHIATEKGHRYVSKRLETHLGGVVFENPFRPAAGLNKNALASRALYALNFGGGLDGTVTLEEQKGNDEKTRIIRIENGLINYLGLPSSGLEAVAWNLSQYSDREYPLGISLGLNKNTNVDHAPEILSSMVDKLYCLVDFFEINGSCLNVENGHSLQDSEKLEKVVKSIISKMIQKGGRKPLSVKVSSDISIQDLDKIIDLASLYQLGIVAVNTSLKKKSELNEKLRTKEGAVSGKYLLDIGTLIVSHIHKSNPNIEIVGCGGIDDLSSVLKYILAGAGSGLQIYTGLVLKGPTLPSSLARELDEWMVKEGVNSISELIGQSFKL